MKIHLEYGKTGLDVEVPDRVLAGVLKLQPQPPLRDPAAAIEAALAAPIGAPPLAELARGARRGNGCPPGRPHGSACVVISDITRPVPNKVLLPPLLATLEGAGIARDRITILIATGTHRPNLGDELIALVGEVIARDYRIVNHVARDADSHRFVGTAPHGTPVYVDRTFLDADLRVSLALIEPHFMAGYSGGRKSLCPGVCSMETVRVWHGPRFIGHPNAESGRLDGNPVHEDALAAARMAGLDFIVDVTLDEQRRITGVFAGDVEAAWLAGVRSVASSVEAPLPAPVDVVLTTCAGYPLDLTFYQAVKGMVGALPVVREGGTVLIAARCAEGIGSAEFTRILRENDDLEAFVARTYEDGFFIPDQWEAHELAKACRKAEILCYTEGIDPATLTECFVTPVPSVEAGLDRALSRHGSEAKVAVIPQGPYVVPILKESR
jgi:nickel-dependent lactate racemase